MAVRTYPIKNDHVNPIRPLRIQDDLMDTANLVEICFEGHLDEDGLRFIQNMKQAALQLQRNKTYSISKFNIPTNGFIWQEDGKTIGCLNTIPVMVQGRSACLIANVAVHPDHRRKGIGRMLTAKAVESARGRGMKSAWLQVRLENQGAVDLYRQLGFVSRSVRTTWHGTPGISHAGFQFPPKVSVTSRHLADWEQQKYWLDRLYPPYLRWHLPLRMDRLKPGFISSVKRYFFDEQVEHLALRISGQLAAVLSRQSTNTQADHLWLAAPMADPQFAVDYLLPYILRIRKRNRTLAVNFPTNLGKSAFEKAGFVEHVNLIWMECPLN